MNNKSPLTNFKCTPLHYAAEFGHVEVCKFILENVEDSLKRRNDDGRTPLDEAREEGQEKVCNFLKLYEDLHKHPAKRPRFSICEKGMISTCRRSINFLVAKMGFETCRNLVIVPIILKS